MDYKERLEQELMDSGNGAGDFYLYRNNQPVNRIVEQINPSEERIKE